MAVVKDAWINLQTRPRGFRRFSLRVRDTLARY
jgi:hypothetical protein